MADIATSHENDAVHDAAPPIPQGGLEVVSIAKSYDKRAVLTDISLSVGKGEFAPVAPAVFEFSVSGFKVVQSWLKYRMKKGAGKKSSPLDDIRPQRWLGRYTTELLELLWVLEATVVGYPEQERLLEAVVSGDCFTAKEIPDAPDELRKPPKVIKQENGLFDWMDANQRRP